MNSQPESFIKKEAKKFRNIFSKSTYADLLSRIHTANGILKTLGDQSFQHRSKDYAKLRVHCALSVHSSRRKLAMSLYNAVLNGDCWNCACKGQHSVQFALDLSLLDLLRTPHKASNHTFRMAFTSKRCTTAVDAWDYCHKVEVESIEISDPVSTCYTCSCPSGSQPSQSDKDKQKAKQSCKLNITEPKARDPLDSKQGDPVSVISDICSAIFTVKFDDKQRALLGCIADKRYQHHMYHVRTIADDLRSKSLKELIATSLTFPQHPC